VEDHYATLQVRPTASPEEIERAYRKLARANHPDLLRQASPEVRQGAEERLKRINVAHRVLGDRDRRRAYDRERMVRAAQPTAPRPRAPHAAAPRPPTAERTSHWGAGGPIDIEWTTPPVRAPRPDTDLFSTRRLIRYSAAIVLFAALLAILWRPGLDRRPAPTPTPLVLATPTSLPANPTPAPTISP
jgi:curved DNA-binding protein CbpA